jgi:hypothetical protein
MEAARISETSVDNYFTRQYIPEDNSELHTRRRERNLTQVSEMEVVSTSKRRSTSSRLHSPTSQKRVIFIFELDSVFRDVTDLRILSRVDMGNDTEYIYIYN